MSYDPKCEELARDFLADWPGIDADRHAPILAQEIQNAIESYISFGEPDEPAAPISTVVTSSGQEAVNLLDRAFGDVGNSASE
jgi:hypothetical protein